MTTPRSRRRQLHTTVSLLAAGALIAACAPGSDVDNGDGDDQQDQEVSTDIEALGEVTLTVWDQEIRGGQNEQIEQLNDAFTETYPNITIQRNSQSFDDLETTLRGALTGDDAPDVVQANNTRGTMGAVVAAGLLTDLHPYAEAYGWRERFSDTVLAQASFSTDGTVFGDGDLYGLPQVGEVVGVFYSRDALDEAGIDEEALTTGTWSDFEDALVSAQEAGQVPMMLGNLDAWPAAHVFGPIQGQHVDPEQIALLGMGNEGASWTTPENEAAAEHLQDWVEAGYFNEGPNGTDYDAAWDSFAGGEGTFLMAGSWLAADIETAMGDDVGFFVPATEDAALVTTGGTGLPFAITEQSPNADAAGAYLDFLTSDEAMEILAETGNMPINNTAELAPESGVNADVFRAFGETSENGYLLPYLDWATPSMGDTIGAALQDLIAGQSDPQEFTEVLEDDYAAFVAGD